MDRLFLTFIIPVYKVKYNQLEKCIKSILEQNYSSEFYEILIIDDGSPDECPEICEKYATSYENVRVLHQKNQGLSVVRNNGIKNARGEWIAFVDGDDWVEPDFVEFAARSVSEVPRDSDILIWDGYSETQRASSPIQFMNISTPEINTYSGATKEILIDRIIPRYVNAKDINRCTDIGVTWGRIYRRDFLIQNQVENIPGLRVMQDSVFNLWAFEAARHICYQYKPLYHYSMYDESISKKYDSKASIEMLKLHGYLRDYIKQCHDTEEYWQRLYIRTVRLLVKCMAKDYANPSNHSSMKERVKKMSSDFDVPEFREALQECDCTGQDFKFIVIHFLLKHRLYSSAICVSKMFGMLRRIKNHVS